MLIGFVGAPSAGKSTFFKAATLADVEIANYPFTTIKPNHAVGYVKVPCADQFFKTQCNPREGYCKNHNRFVPINLMDVAGLVPGASEGKGCGNAFLDDLRNADVLIHIVDISGSTNEKGESVPVLSYDPLNTIRFLEEEINLWYFNILKKGWERFARQIQQESIEVYRAIAKQLSGLKVTEDHVKEIVKQFPSDPTKWNDDLLKELTKKLRELSKPIIIAANKIDVPGSEKNIERAKKEFPNYLIILCSAEIELALREAGKKEIIDYVPGESNFTIKSTLNEKQQTGLNLIKQFLEKYKTTGIQNILNIAVFDFLKYLAIFPGGLNKLEDSQGRILPDCFLLPEKSTALDFAYKLHTDLGKNFIRAIDIKSKRTVGKDYQLNHLDVIEIIAK
ncbi:MAG TPA: redox-regulated ATPase YchF [Candidatus Nanoarchaeia archaeon]|nr:redox-regulated ATPase YchF [Candidatus Nanoarchaeia archaeon]